MTERSVLFLAALRLGPDTGTPGDVWLRQSLGHDAFQLRVTCSLQGVASGDVLMLGQLDHFLAFVLGKQCLKSLLALYQGQRAEIFVINEQQIKGEKARLAVLPAFIAA